MTNIFLKSFFGFFGEGQKHQVLGLDHILSGTLSFTNVMNDFAELTLIHATNYNQ